MRVGIEVLFWQGDTIILWQGTIPLLSLFSWLMIVLRTELTRARVRWNWMLETEREVRLTEGTCLWTYFLGSPYGVSSSRIGTKTLPAEVKNSPPKPFTRRVFEGFLNINDTQQSGTKMIRCRATSSTTSLTFLSISQAGCRLEQDFSQLGKGSWLNIPKLAFKNVWSQQKNLLGNTTGLRLPCIANLNFNHSKAGN